MTFMTSLMRPRLVRALVPAAATAVLALSATPALAVGPEYGYAGTFNGSGVSLAIQTNVSVENDLGAVPVGSVSNFQTHDPAYSCLNGGTINVWLDPLRYGLSYVAHNGGQGAQCAYGTWLLGTSYDGNHNLTAYSYSCGGHNLGLVTNVTVEGQADATLIGTCSNFQTNDPFFSCLNGENINEWSAPAEFPNGQTVIHNGWMGPQCTYGTWTF